MLKPRMIPLLAFLIPLMVRAIPEILMWPYVVGFDPMGYYIPNVLMWLRNGVSFWQFLGVAPLFYTVLMGTTSLGIPLTLALKVMPPLLHGFLALTIYLYVNRALGWSSRKSLFAALLATLYFVALRVSWDLLRNELGLAFLFITLTLLHKGKGWLKHYALLSLAMILVVLSHQLVSVIMLFIIAITIVHAFLNKKYGEARSLILSSMPAMLLFLLIVYANYATSPNFTAVSGFPGKELEGWFSLYGFSSYKDMVANTLGFLLYCYLPLLPLAIIGVKQLKNLQIKSWILWSLTAVVSPIFSPNAFISGGFRWTLTLSYPLAFYAIEALSRLKLNLLRLFVGLILATLSIGFVAMPYGIPLSYHGRFPYYIPSSMLENTVPLSDCQNTVNALEWLRSNIDGDARLLTHTAFHGWALLVLNEEQVIPYDYENPEKAAQDALQEGPNQLYLIWWTNGNGWHGQPTVPPSFKEVRRFGEIAIYMYGPVL